MLYSVENGDRGDVFLNGEPVTHVLWCNTELGVLSRSIIDEDRKFMVVNGEVPTEIVFGTVEFKLFKE